MFYLCALMTATVNDAFLSCIPNSIFDLSVTITFIFASGANFSAHPLCTHFCTLLFWLPALLDQLHLRDAIANRGDHLLGPLIVLDMLVEQVICSTTGRCSIGL